MIPDLISFALNLLNKIGPYNVKLEQIWPILKNMASEATQILTILNGGKAVALAGTPTTPKGIELVKKLRDHNVDAAEANNMAITFEALHSRIAD